MAILVILSTCSLYPCSAALVLTWAQENKMLRGLNMTEEGHTIHHSPTWTPNMLHISISLMRTSPKLTLK